jgi:hypothetical protein
MHLIAALLLAAPAAAPAPAASVDTYPTTQGTVGVSFFLPTGTDPRLVGLTYFLSNDSAVRADFGMLAPLTPSGQSVLFSASAGLRLYQMKRERVAVFVQPVAGLGREQSPAVSGETTWFVRIGGGVGVEYFFTPRFSVGAILELTLKFADIGESGGNSVFTTLSTDTSSISANIYF